MQIYVYVLAFLNCCHLSLVFPPCPTCVGNIDGLNLGLCFHAWTRRRIQVLYLGNVEQIVIRNKFLQWVLAIGPMQIWRLWHMASPPLSPHFVVWKPIHSSLSPNKQPLTLYVKKRSTRGLPRTHTTQKC